MIQVSEKYSLSQAKTLAEVFEYSIEKGYDSEKFVYKLCHNEMCAELLENELYSDWRDPLYMLSTLNQFAEFEQGDTYDGEVMWFMGYLYKYLIAIKDISPSKAYEIAPPSMIRNDFTFLHTQGWEYIVKELTARYEERHG